MGRARVSGEGSGECVRGRVAGALWLVAQFPASLGGCCAPFQGRGELRDLFGFRGSEPPGQLTYTVGEPARLVSVTGAYVAVK